MDAQFYEEFKDLETSSDEENNQAIEEEKQKDQNQTEKINGEMQKQDKISLLIEDDQFQSHLAEVKQLQTIDIQKIKLQIGTADKEYNVIVKSNHYVTCIDSEIQKVHKLVGDLYSPKFPQLENILPNPIEYVQCILRIKNQTDLNKINLKGILTNHQIIAVTVAGSSTQNPPLSQENLDRTLKACNIILGLNNNKTTLLKYIESRMLYIAPNLSKICTSAIAAKLIGAAGGIQKLARIPACNIQVMGEKKQNLLGMSKQGKKLHFGFFGSMSIVKKAPKNFQRRLVRRLSNSCAKAAKIDAGRACPNGSLGQKMYEKMVEKFLKEQESQPAQMRKPLPIPLDKPGRRRGGKKYRNMRKKLAQTQLAKQRNRLKFGVDASQEYGYTGEDFGMIGMGGKLKIPISKSSLKITKKQQKILKHKSHSGKQSGFETCLDLASKTGIAFLNPEYMKFQREKQNSSSYFKPEQGFQTVIAQKQLQSRNKK